jgi:hypothetical protein
MIIYNVTVTVENSVADEWVRWMKEEHIPDLMSTGMFVDARLSYLLEQDETEAKTYSAQYFCESMDQYHAYIDQHAPNMREKAFSRFGNKFVAFRTVMQVVN